MLFCKLERAAYIALQTHHLWKCLLHNHPLSFLPMPLVGGLVIVKTAPDAWIPNPPLCLRTRYTTVLSNGQTSCYRDHPSLIAVAGLPLHGDRDTPLLLQQYFVCLPAYRDAHGNPAFT